MIKWHIYKQQAKQRGALALELYAVESVAGDNRADMQKYLSSHLAYQAELAKDGVLAFAGPTSDATGAYLSGGGLIVYKAPSLQHAINIAKQDPMHIHKVRTFTVKKWLVNESCFDLKQ